MKKTIRGRGARKTMTTKRIFIGIALLASALLGYTVHLDNIVRQQFEGKRFALPAQIYARPLELFVGKRLRPEQLKAELQLLRYTPSARPDSAGQYFENGIVFVINTRSFLFWDGEQSAQRIRVNFKDDVVTALADARTSQDIAIARLDPALIGGIYPDHNEDRDLIRLDQVPPTIIDALLTIEDRRYYQHSGIDPRGMLRALASVFREGRTQGGSTITQQLVKNFYLSPERTLWRKFNEVLMALLLELHYEKDDILETYLNEVYLGQDGGRAIHGFGLASRFYFDRRIDQLEIDQAALLVAMLKGPTRYNPRSAPERALQRRNLVLDELAAASPEWAVEYENARTKPLGISQQPGRGTARYPAFVDVVREQLSRDYDEADLQSEGLRIFSTVDPIVQDAAEKALITRLDAIEKSLPIEPQTLQGAVVVSDTQSGELHAIVGDRVPQYAGFNRALSARRQVGSLMKPVMYLAALEQPEQYSLSTLLDDTELVWEEPGIEPWRPQNYDNEYHGQVPLHMALAKSYNVAAARLGLTLGIDHVVETAHRLGAPDELPLHASIILGTNTLTPLEAAGLYQTIASGGFRMPLRAIREVLTHEGERLQRYPLAVEQVIDAAPAFLLTTGLQGVVRDGTASGVSGFLSTDLNLAGKTGTTDGLRDSWYAGFSGDRLGVVWLGSDEEQSIGLTGSSGALRVWGEMMQKLDPQPLLLATPDNIEMAAIDATTQLRVDEHCEGAVVLPFVRGSAPQAGAPCTSAKPANKIKRIFQHIFGDNK